MITEYDANAAVANRSILVTDDDVTGQAVDIDTNPDNTAVRIVASGTSQWVDIAHLNPTVGLAKCGRCSNIVAADTIDASGPYLTCPPCTEILRAA